MAELIFVQRAARDENSIRTPREYLSVEKGSHETPSQTNVPDKPARPFPSANGSDMSHHMTRLLGWDGTIYRPPMLC